MSVLTLAACAAPRAKPQGIGPFLEPLGLEECAPPRVCACFDIDAWEAFYIRNIIGIEPKEEPQ